MVCLCLRTLDFPPNNIACICYVMSATLRGRTPLRHSGHVSLLARARPSSSTIVLPSFYLLLPSRGASLSAPCPPLLLHFSHGILFTHRLLALSCPTYCRLQHLTPSSFLLCPSEPQTTPWSPCPLFVSQVQRKHGSGHKCPENVQIC